MLTHCDVIDTRAGRGAELYVPLWQLKRAVLLWFQIMYAIRDLPRLQVYQYKNVNHNCTDVGVQLICVMNTLLHASMCP